MSLKRATALFTTTLLIGMLIGLSFSAAAPPNPGADPTGVDVPAYYLGGVNITPRLQGTWSSTQLTANSVNFTTIYVAAIDEATSNGKVEISSLLVEHASSFPASPQEGQILFRSDWDKLNIYNGTAWLNVTGTGVGVSDHGALSGLGDDDHTIYLLASGARALSGNWNIGATRSIIGGLWLNSTKAAFNQLYVNGANITGGSSSAPWGADYIFYKSGATTYALNGRTGNIDYSGANSLTVMQNALDDLAPLYSSAGGSALIMPGWYTIDSGSLQIPPRVTLKGSGTWITKLTANSNNPVIKPKYFNYTCDVWIDGLSLSGNSQANHVLEWITNSSSIPTQLGGYWSTYGFYLKLTNLHITGQTAGGYVIYMKTNTGLQGNTITFWNQLRTYGRIYIERIYDSFFDNVVTNALNMTKVATDHFSNWYIGGSFGEQVHMFGGTAEFPNRGNSFTNFRIDWPTQTALVIEGYSTDNVFAGCFFANLHKDSDDNQYPAVLLQGNSNGTVLTGNYFGSFRATSPRFKYLIQEAGSTKYNTFSGNFLEPGNYGTAAYALLPNSGSGPREGLQAGLGSGVELTFGATRYLPVQGSLTATTSTEARTQFYVSRTGMLMNLRIYGSGGATNATVFVLRKNGANTTVTLTIAAAAGASTYIDTTHTVAVERGDLVDVAAFTGSTDAATIYFVFVELVG